MCEVKIVFIFQLIKLVTTDNLNKYKCELYAAYKKTEDLHTLINETYRLGWLYELTKGFDKECSLEDVIDLFGKEY